MGIAQDLNAKTLELRKARADIAGGFQSVQAFAQAFAKERGLKGGDTTVTDEDALRGIQRGIKMCRDTIEAAGPDNMTDGVLDRTERELVALEALLPEMASEDDVRNAARAYITNHQPDPKKGMGQVIGHLSGAFGTALDKSMAARVAKEELAQINA